MAKEKGYVYYEADCSMGFTNPFLDIHAKNVFQAQMASAPEQDKLNPPLCIMEHVMEQIKKPGLATT